MLWVIRRRTDVLAMLIDPLVGLCLPTLSPPVARPSTPAIFRAGGRAVSAGLLRRTVYELDESSRLTHIWAES